MSKRTNIFKAMTTPPSELWLLCTKYCILLHTA